MEILVDVVDVLLTWNRCFLICLNPDSFDFFSNVTTVLPPSGHLGDRRRPFRGSGNYASNSHPAQHPRKGKTAA